MKLWIIFSLSDQTVLGKALVVPCLIVGTSDTSCKMFDLLKLFLKRFPLGPNLPHPP